MSKYPNAQNLAKISQNDQNCQTMLKNALSAKKRQKYLQISLKMPKMTIFTKLPNDYLKPPKFYFKFLNK